MRASRFRWPSKDPADYRSPPRPAPEPQGLGYLDGAYAPGFAVGVTASRSFGAWRVARWQRRRQARVVSRLVGGHTELFAV